MVDHHRCRLTKTQSILFMLCLTSSFFFVELIVGHVTKSNALVADAFHMLSDIISLVIGLIAVRMSKKTSPRNTFGWVRAEVLGSLINAVFLLALCFSIIIEAINRFVEPQQLEKINLMLIVGAIGLIINLIGLLIFGLHSHSHSHDHGHSHSSKNYDGNNQDLKEIHVINSNNNEVNEEKDKKVKSTRSTQNMNIHGVFLHVLSDALGSIAVLISGLLVKYVPPEDDSSVEWKLYIDPVLSLVISILIISSTIPLLKESSLVLLQTIPSRVDIEELKNIVRKVPGVINLHHFHVWSLNSEKLIGTAHLSVDKREENNNLVLEDVKRVLHKFDIHATTIQLEYNDSGDKNYDICDSIDCVEKQCCVKEKEHEDKGKF